MEAGLASESRSTTSILSGFEQGLEDLPDVDFLTHFKRLDEKLKHLKLENIYYLKYLENVDPLIITSIYHQLKRMDEKQKGGGSIHSNISNMSFTKRSSFQSVQTVDIKTTRALSGYQKTEMLLKIMEDIEMDFQKFKKTAANIIHKLKAEQEEANTSFNDIKEAVNVFETSVVLEGFDRLTQRIPAEKFIRYMDDWSKTAQAMTQKLLLRINNQKVQLTKYSNRYIQRQELVENIHAVDFDKLNIENKNYLKAIEDKGKHVKELKKMNGWANLILSTHKHYLQSQYKDTVDLKNLIQDAEQRVVCLTDEQNEVEKEIFKARENFDVLKSLIQNYFVPDTMEYVNIKSNLYDVYKKLKITERRKKILDITLNACTTQMKNLVGVNKVNPEWLMEYKESNPDFFNLI